MSTVLVTIVGPSGRADAAAPADAPVGELAAALADLAATHGRDAPAFRGGAAGRATLAADRGLAEQGVVDGDVLVLRADGAVDRIAAGEDAGATLRRGGGSPLQRTRDTLPEWVGVVTRLRCAARAWRAGDPDGAFTRRACMGAAWRATSYRDRLQAQIATGRPRRAITIAVVGDGARPAVATLLATLLAALREEDVDVLPAGGGEPRRTPGAIAILDCPAQPCDRATWQAATIAASDQVVLVADACGAGLDADMAALLERTGKPVVLVADGLARGARLDAARVERELPFARGLVVLPFEPAPPASAGSWEDCPRAWDLPLHELALLLVADWPA